MMAAVQPFLSGAISKTVNMPNEATVDDVREAYLEGWKLGLKALAIYRDGSKGSQPVSTKSEGDGKTEAVAKVEPTPAPAPVLAASNLPRRERLPHTRRSLTHKFDIQGHEGYVNVGFYPDGRPGELFITMAKEGSTIGGLMDVLGTSISIGLQYGVPLEVFVNKFAHSRFEPAGFTQEPGHPDREERRRLHFPLAGHGVHPRLPRRERSPAPAEPSRHSPNRPRWSKSTATAPRRSPTSNTPRPSNSPRSPRLLPSSPFPTSPTPSKSATSNSPTSRATPPPATTAAR